MTLWVNNEEKRLSLRPWNEADNQYGCDCFADIERNVVTGSEMSQEEFDQLVEFWEDEVAWYNAGNASECLGDPDESPVKEFLFEVN